jgi:hypothetical protein
VRLECALAVLLLQIIDGATQQVKGAVATEDHPTRISWVPNRERDGEAVTVPGPSPVTVAVSGPPTVSSMAMTDAPAFLVMAGATALLAFITTAFNF